MRISDWSSDVCSSDLGDARPAGPQPARNPRRHPTPARPHLARGARAGGRDRRRPRPVRKESPMTASKSASTTAKPPSNAEELKAAQAPLKARYRETADSAVVTFRAEGRLDEGIACKVD